VTANWRACAGRCGRVVRGREAWVTCPPCTLVRLVELNASGRILREARESATRFSKAELAAHADARVLRRKEREAAAARWAPQKLEDTKGSPG
jgi:hypothetical protein